MTTEEMTIALLELKSKIEQCRANSLWLTVNTLRHQVMTIAETFVDPTWAAEQEERVAPVLRSGIMMSLERDIIDGVLTPF